MKPTTELNIYDRATNQVRVDIGIRADGLDERAEGWKIEIVKLSSPSAITGTDTISSRLDDLPEPILGRNKADKNLAGTADGDDIRGRGGNDLISVRGGNDLLDGGAGKDTLFGGEGADTLTGGKKADVFLFRSIGDSTPDDPDLITDFGRGDRIDLSEIDAKPSSAADDAFHFLGLADAFRGKAGDLRIEQDDRAGTRKDATWVLGDVDGDGKSDFAIRIAGLVTLHEGDFVL